MVLSSVVLKFLLESNPTKSVPHSSEDTLAVTQFPAPSSGAPFAHPERPLGFPYISVGRESTCNAGDPGSIPGSRRSPGEGNGNPFQYSCLENLMDRGAWRATVHGVTRVGYDLATTPPPPEAPPLLWGLKDHQI